MSDAPHIILCSPRISTPNVDGSVIIMADCGHEVWIAPSGMQFHLSSELTTVYCLPCGLRLAKECGVADLKAVPGSRPEVEREVGKIKADEIFDIIKEHRQ